MAYVDSPNKKQKYSHYEHQTTKLESKDNDFDSKKFNIVEKLQYIRRFLNLFKELEYV